MDALVACLADTLSSDAEVRQRAETSLAQRAYPVNDADGAHGIELAQVLGTDAVPLPLRQAAGIALKKYVYERWSVYFDEFLRAARAADAVGEAGAVPADAKHAVHAALLSALGAVERKVRLLAAQLLAIVASCDFPDHFPELLPTLRTYLEVHDARAGDRLHGAMKFLGDFVQAELDENQLLGVAQEFLPLLLGIVGDTSGAVAPHTQARCVLVFRQCLTSLSMVRDTYASDVEAAVAAYVPAWLMAFGALLDVPVARADWRSARAWEALAVQREVVRTLGVAARFRKVFAPHAGALLSACLALLEALAPVFAGAELVAVPAYEAPEAPEGDADVATGVAGVAVAVLTLFSETLETRAMRTLLVAGGAGGDGAATPALAQLLRVLTVYAQLTREDEEAFEDDPGAFVDEDDEENMSVTLRTSAADALDTLLDAYPLPVLRTLPALVRDVLGATDGGAVVAWKWREAALMLLGNTHQLVEEVLDTVGADAPPDALLQPAHVVHTLAVPSMAPGTPSFLRGRAFVFTSQYVGLLGGTAAQDVLRAALDVLGAPAGAAPLHVRLSAVRAVRNVAQRDGALCVDDARAVVRALGPLLLEARGSPLVLLLDALEAALGAPWAPADAPLLEDVGRAALHAWRTHAADPLVEISLAALLEALVRRDAPGAAGVVRAAAAVAADALRADDAADTGLGASAAAVARSVLAAAPPALLDGAVAPLLAAGTHYLVHADDAEAAQNLVFCLTLLWQKRPADVLAWDDHGMPALEVVLRIVEHELARDAVSMPLGVLLVTLFLQADAHAAAGAALGAVMPALVRALAAKLAAVDAADAVLALLLPLQFLVAQHTDAALALLATPTAGADAPLAAVVAQWLDHADLVLGRALGNLHTLALARLYTQWPAALDALEVRGGVRALHADAGIVTRSRARSAELYERVPARVRAASLLAHAFQAQDDERAAAADLAAAVDLGAGGDEEGWEDDEEANAADAARDARRRAFLDEVLDLGLGEEADADEDAADAPYLAPAAALPGFAPIAQLDRAAAAAGALRSTPAALVARLAPDVQAAVAAAHAYQPT